MLGQSEENKKEGKRMDVGVAELEAEESGTADLRNPLKVFLSGSIRGGRDLLPTYHLIYDLLQEAGAEVVSWHVVDPELEAVESEMTEGEIYARDMGLLSESDALVAEVTVPSVGVGYEICRALAGNLPVLCLHRPEAAVSSMLLGNPTPNFRVAAYSGPEEIRAELAEFLERAAELKNRNRLKK